VGTASRPRIVFSLPAALGVGGMGRGMFCSVRAALEAGWETHVISAPGGVRPDGAQFSTVDVSRWVRAANLTPARFSPAWLRLVLNGLHDRSAKHKLAACDLFQGAAGASLHTIRAAGNAGAKCVLECMTIHARQLDRLMRIEEAAAGSSAHFHNSQTVTRSEKEYRRADLLYCNSSLTQRSLEEQGIDRSRVFEAPLAVSLPAEAAKLAKDARFRVLFVGYLTLIKGFRHLLAAWERLGLPDAELYLRGGTGDRACRRILEDFRRRIGFIQDLERGPVPYHEFSVLVLPSISEGFGLVVLEAMAAGLPVIVTENVGAGDCVRKGTDGFVIPPANPDALAEHIEVLYRDRNRLAEMGQAARARAAEFSHEAFSKRYIAAVRRLIGAG